MSYDNSDNSTYQEVIVKISFLLFGNFLKSVKWFYYHSSLNHRWNYFLGLKEKKSERVGSIFTNIFGHFFEHPGVFFQMLSIFRCVNISRTYPSEYIGSSVADTFRFQITVQKRHRHRAPVDHRTWYIFWKLWPRPFHLGEPTSARSAFFLNIVQKGGGGSNPCSKNMLQILYDYKGLLAT